MYTDLFFIGFLLSVYLLFSSQWLLLVTVFLFCCVEKILLSWGVNNNKLVTKIFFSTRFYISSYLLLWTGNDFFFLTASGRFWSAESVCLCLCGICCFFSFISLILVYYHATLLSGCFFFFIISIRFVYMT